MRIRIRGPTGQNTIILEDNARVLDLKKRIAESTSIKDFDVKYGFPPKPLDLEELGDSHQLSDLNLNGEQLIIAEKVGSNSIQTVTQSAPPSSTQQDKSNTAEPLSLTRKAPSDDPPEIAIPSHGATLVLRIMPDDNSCLFRAFNSAYFGAMDNMHELRSIIAQTIQANQDTYPEVVLEKPPDDYCRWIQHPDSWGGSIELQILSNHFDIEICSIDVQTLRVDHYNEGRPQRCILVYSGIHYDVVALSPSDPPYNKSFAPPEFDEKVFSSADEEILLKARELCKILQGKGYFTDTAGFSIRCNDCGGSFKGEKGAIEHANLTGHTNFGEA
jgi:ubiquitin thioesterase OTU1